MDDFLGDDFLDDDFLGDDFLDDNLLGDDFICDDFMDDNLLLGDLSSHNRVYNCEIKGCNSHFKQKCHLDKHKKQSIQPMKISAIIETVVLHATP
jgi:hypothetical protein